MAERAALSNGVERRVDIARVGRKEWLAIGGSD